MLQLDVAPAGDVPSPRGAVLLLPSHLLPQRALHPYVELLLEPLVRQREGFLPTLPRQRRED
jgi:hypothetical protein